MIYEKESCELLLQRSFEFLVRRRTPQLHRPLESRGAL